MKLRRLLAAVLRPLGLVVRTAEEDRHQRAILRAARELLEEKEALAAKVLVEVAIGERE